MPSLTAREHNQFLTLQLLAMDGNGISQYGKLFSVVPLRSLDGFDPTAWYFFLLHCVIVLINLSTVFNLNTSLLAWSKPNSSVNLKVFTRCEMKTLYTGQYEYPFASWILFS